MLHIVLPHGGRGENPRGAEVQAGGDALAPPQRGVRLRHHRQTALRSMRTAAMDAYFFNEIKSPCTRDRRKWYN